MAVSIRNVEKFLEDHPELTDRREEIMNAAQQAAEGGILPGSVAEKILGDTADLFFKEVLRDPEHISLGLEDLRSFSSGFLSTITGLLSN